MFDLMFDWWVDVMFFRDSYFEFVNFVISFFCWHLQFVRGGKGKEW